MQKRTLLWIIIAINLISILFLIPLIQSNTLVFDDPQVLISNTFTHKITHARYLVMEDYFLLSGESTYRPLVTFSYMLDHFILGDEPWLFHLSNALYHLAAGLFFGAVLISIFKSPVIIILSAGIFAFHAAAFEAIASAGFREDILCALFVFMAINSFIRGQSSKRSWLHFTVLIIATCLGLLSKETAIVIPVILLVIAYTGKFPVRYSGIRIAAVTLLILTFIVLWMIILPDNSGIRDSGAETMLITRLSSAPALLAAHLRLCVLPHPLCADHAPVQWNLETGFFFIILMIGLIGGVKKRSAVGAGLLLFIAGLLPVINIYPILNMEFAERYLYLPLAGYSIAAAAGVNALLFRIKSGSFRKIVFLLCICGLIVVPAVLRSLRISDWKDNISLWQSTVETNPESAMGWINLGINSKFLQDRRNFAWECHRTAYRLEPDNYQVNFAIAVLLNEEQKTDEALPYYQETIRLNPDHLQAHAYLGIMYAQREDYMSAIPHFIECLRINPRARTIRNYLIQAQVALINNPSLRRKQ